MRSSLQHTKKKESGSPTKGAGTQASRDLIEQAQKEQLPVELSALVSAKVFWKNLGFEVDPTKAATDDAIRMILLPLKT